MTQMEIKLKTLTPLWTGGVETGKMDRIHETGLIGSLRWWYEAIVRGLGGEACDPSESRCEVDAKKYRKSTARDERERLRDAGLCDVCQVFGATGWRRRFRLEVGKDNTEPVWIPEDRMLNIRPPDRSRGWYLPAGRMGTLTLRIDGDDRVLNLLIALFLFLEKRGNLGAKPQLGYGVFTIENQNDVKGRIQDWQWTAFGSRGVNMELPDLRRFCFFRYRFQPQKPGWWTRVPGMERVATFVQPVVSAHTTVPIAPALKNEWRFHRWQRNWGDERDFFGTLQPARIRSKVAVSWAYKTERAWETRGYAWLQGVRQAKDVWKMFCNTDVWRKVISVPGELDVRPRELWQPWSVAELERYLEETL